MIKPYLVALFHAIVIAPSVLPCPKTQEHQSTCVDSWVHRVPENGHQPQGTRQFTMAFSLPNIVIKPYLVNAIWRRSPHCAHAHCPKTQEHQSTCVDSWVHRVPENGHQPLGRGNSLKWRSACPILWSNPILLRAFTKVDVPFSGTLWTHESTQVLWCSWVLGQESTEGAIFVK